LPTREHTAFVFPSSFLFERRDYYLVVTANQKKIYHNER